ncbi:MAG: crossover junction endodeoxyribonuclease RuvC [Bryobacteraceae bacterium]
MVVLGIDCGSERTGYGVIDTDGRTHRLVRAGVVRTSPQTPFPERLRQIAVPLRQLILEYRPEAAAIEAVFHAVNAKTALKLAHVRGVALLVLAEAGLAVGEYSALEVKASVVGYGRAGKGQVRTMVHSLLRIKDPVDSEDACDAIAVAICHATHESSRRRIETCSV